MTIYRTILAFLAALSADPNAIEQERPRAYASYRVAYATFAPADDSEPKPQPEPPKPTPRPTREPAAVCPCGGACSAACSCGCRGAGCPNGNCPIPAKPRTPGGK